MRIIRSNVFETNSSAEHALCIDTRLSADTDVMDYMTRSYEHEKKLIASKINNKTNEYVIPKDPDFDYGMQDTFEVKMNYILYLLVLAGVTDEDRSDTVEYNKRMDDDSFTGTSANRILHTYYKDLVDRLVKYINDTYKIKCTDIVFPTAPKKAVYCRDNLNHQIKWDSSFKRGKDGEIMFDGVSLFDIITTENINIEYAFC